MKCSYCGKPAVHHITRITAGGPKTIDLCQEHYEQFSEPGAAALNLEVAIKQQGAEAAETADLPFDLTCSTCGQTFRQFRDSSKFGCAGCYVSYEEQLVPLLKHLHHAEQHTGKVPRGGADRARVREELQQLRRAKDEAVRNEDFELAARLRDRIRELEGTDNE